MSALPFTWLVLNGRLDLLQNHPAGAFFDAQAHSWLDLRWDVPAEVLGFEAILVDGRAYMYFGPVPALLRLPFSALTSSLDGRLTALSMLLAFGLTLACTSRLSWQARVLLRGPLAPVTRTEVWVSGAFVFLMGAGSTLLTLAGQTYVFHEAILWGVALSLAAYVELLRYLIHRARGALVLTAVFAVLAMLTRASVGLGPVVALALVLGSRIIGEVGARRRPALRSLVPLAVAVLMPLMLYGAVNQIKFGSLLNAPFQNQLLARVDPQVAEALRENGGSLFGAKYLPTTVLSYLRPNGLGLDRTFPFVDFPPLLEPAGDVRFHRIDRSASLVSTMPWLVVLAAVGLVTLLRRRSPHARWAGSVLWAPLVGATVGFAVTIAIAYVANRYLADATPLLLLLGAVGLHALLGWAEGRRRAGARWVLGGLAVVGLVAFVVNGALGLVYQRQYGFVPETLRAEFVAWQHDVDEALPGDQSPTVRTGPLDGGLPPQTGEGDLFVVGNCDGMYQFDGAEWRAVERTAAVGRFRVRFEVPDGKPHTRYALVRAGSGSDERSLSVEPVGDGKVAFAYTEAQTDHAVRAARGVRSGQRRTFDVVMDRLLQDVQVFVDGRQVFGAVSSAPDGEVLRLAQDFPGGLDNQVLDPSVCHSLRR